MRTRPLVLLLALAVAGVAAGCSGSDPSVSTATSSVGSSGSTPTTGGAATTSADEASADDSATSTDNAGTNGDQTTTTDPGSVASVREKATAALLTPEELGPGFGAGTWSPSDPSRPSPCGTPTAESTVPAAVRVGAVLGKPSTQQALQEEIGVYTSTDEVDEAFAVGSTGLACANGTVTFDDGTSAPLAISAPVDVTSEVGGDVATAWQLQGGGIQGVLVAVKLSGIVVTFQFVAPAEATALTPEPLAVAKAGMDKILST